MDRIMHDRIRLRSACHLGVMPSDYDTARVKYLGASIRGGALEYTSMMTNV